jgi:hypothetical protein
MCRSPCYAAVHSTTTVCTCVPPCGVPAGVNVVFDPVGGAALFESLKCVAWGAQYLVIGFAAGDIPKVGKL